MLHPAIGKNRYCGPGALAMLTGCSTDEAARLIRQNSGQLYVKGAANKDVLAALFALGCTVRPVPVVTWKRFYEPPLREFVKTLQAGRYLVEVTRHYVAVDVEAGEVGDNVSVTPRTFAEFRRGGKKVRKAWLVIQ